MAKSAAGSGTIRKKTVTRKGKKYTFWEARYTVGTDPGTGRQIQRSISGKTQKEVAQKLKAVTAAIDAGTYQEPNKITVGQWVKEWIETYAANSVKPYTLAAYRGILTRHITPRLGAIPLQQLKGNHIQKFYNDLVKSGNTRNGKGLTGKSVKNINAVLHKSLSQAVKLGYIASNPCDAATLPKVQNKEIHPLTDAEIPPFLKAIDKSPLRNIFAVMLFCGLREGEAMGLSWDKVDFEKQSLTISQQLQHGKEKGQGYWLLDSTKGGRPRTISPPPISFDYIKAERALQTENRLRAGSAWNNEWNLVFTRPDGQHLAFNTIWLEFKRIARAIGRPDLRPHDLRHTCATVALAAGSDVKSVQSLMGHATASFTLDKYAHTTERMKQDTADRMQAYYDSLRA